MVSKNNFRKILILRNQAMLSVIPALFENVDIKEYEGAIMNDISTSIAFNIMVHSHPGILELFLALYFRPDNHHVFHLDKKATNKMRKTFSNIINCYSTKVSSGNIILLSKEESVAIQWGTSSILKANLVGYRSLLKMNQDSRIKWSHVITNAGSELPILTYASFRLQIQHRLNSTGSSVETFPIPKGNMFRVSEDMKKNCVRDSCKSAPWMFQMPNPLKPNTNYTFQVFKGTHIKSVLSSKDANFIANSSISKAYYSWIKKMKVSAEEHHTATLLRLNIDYKNNISQDIKGTKEEYDRGICQKYVTWNENENICKGKWIHSVCNFGVGDLDRIQASSCLFANKFNLDVDKNAAVNHFLHVLNLTFSETYSIK